ncbi:ABC transporter ATP-binding protein [bacterium]|nr:ABC transporter ATP-binding protein [bacterium]MCP5462799.1 ABC transporter ATP-binding protein [bacterium]
MNVIIRIAKFGKPYKKYLFLAVIFMLFNTVFEGLSIITIVPAVDKVISGNPVALHTSVPVPFLEELNGFLGYLSKMDRMKVFEYICLFMLVMFIIKGIAYYYSRLYMEMLGQHLVKDMRAALFNHVESLSLDFFSKGKTGALMSRVTADIQVILNLVSGRFANTLIEVPKFFIYAAIIIIIDWKLVVALLGLPFVILPIIIIGKKLRKLSKVAQHHLADLNAILFEVITGIKIVQAFSMEKTELGRFVKQNITYYKSRIKAVKLDAILNPITEITGIIIGFAIMLFRVPLIISGELSAGTFTLQIAAVLSMVKPLKTLGKINSMLQQALGAADRIFEILDIKPTIVEKPHPAILQPLSENITFQHVSFWYEKNDRKDAILTDLDFSIKRGEIAAFVGPSGAGKTTILNLVPRFYDPQEGRIMIDGVDLRDASLESIRSQLGIVTQETILFNETIQANITYGKTEYSTEQIEYAARMANAHGFIKELPHGYDTIIGEKGVKLSGGQRQRIAIARAILKNPPILILDEATSALDSESEKLVQEAIDHVMEKRTVLVVAHRLSTIRHADKIFVLDKGKIQDCASHDELLKCNKLYQKLYEMQFGMAVGSTQ